MFYNEYCGDILIIIIYWGWVGTSGDPTSVNAVFKEVSVFEIFYKNLSYRKINELTIGLKRIMQIYGASSFVGSQFGYFTESAISAFFDSNNHSNSNHSNSNHSVDCPSTSVGSEYFGIMLSLS